MCKAIKYLILSALVLTASGFSTAHGQVPVDSRMSGSWYEPAHDGEGFVLEVLQNGDAVVYWFTYDETGRQRWFVGTGTVEDDSVNFEVLWQTGGAVFGAQFDADKVVYSDVGTLSITWSDCFSATALYTIDDTQGSQALTRLTSLTGLDCEAPTSTPSSMSGSWFDPTHDGEGLVIEILENDSALVFWFSYDEQGNQAWFYGLGNHDGNKIVIPDMQITSGGEFGPGFNPQLVQHEPWGTLEIELGCDFGKFDYDSGLLAYGDGKQTLSRLTAIGEPDCEETQSPNILLIIADDLGLDASNQYDVSVEKPATPTLDQLANEGLVFENAWSNPTCSPTRAGILTGKFSTRTGVFAPGDVLSDDESSLQSYIHQHLPGKYVDAVIGKWHLGPQPGGLDHPASLGIDHFAGIIGGGVDDYKDWTLVKDGQRSSETEYVTSKLVDLSIEWTNAQDQPWFLWLAFNAPHTPFHLPPADLHSRDLSGIDADIDANPLPYYFAAIEAMDMEIDRLLDSLDAETRANTIVVFVGDNGTPAQVAQSPYSRTKAKGSLYQGGVNVPLFIAGPGVTRAGEREIELVNTTDLFSTIAALAGVNVEEVNDSISFVNLLGEKQVSTRFFQFTERSTDEGEEWAISDGIYKLIESDSGSREFYELTTDPFENTNLVTTGTVPGEIVNDLQYLADQIRAGSQNAKSFAIVDTGQNKCYDDEGAYIVCPGATEAFYGQDAQNAGHQPNFTDNGDGTVSDNVTGLMWQKSPDTDLNQLIDAQDKLTFSQAQSYCEDLDLADYTDWWLPDIKQLYSLINFSGTDPSGYEGDDTSDLVPFIDASYFDFAYGDATASERIIDAQYASSVLYTSNTGNDGGQTLFGVNFADGRIKGYGLSLMGQDKTFYVICSRGNEDYGQNDFVENGDGTVTDQATGLMWALNDSTTGLNWEEALAWVEQQNNVNHLGYNDWKLPDAKQLQSLVDYTRSPGLTDSAAIDPLFNSSGIVNEAGDADYPAYWSSTTHINWTSNPGSSGVYISFGRSMGYMNNSWVDVHGAGAQRSDPKAGDPADYPVGRGPQGDAIRIYNHVRLVRVR